MQKYNKFREIFSQYLSPRTGLHEVVKTVESTESQHLLWSVTTTLNYLSSSHHTVNLRLPVPIFLALRKKYLLLGEGVRKLPLSG